MNVIIENIKELEKSIPENVKLICVSKFHPVEAIMVAYEAGIRDFGESRVQELQIKQPQLPKDINWHFIGHLQRNKVKYIAPFVSLIHGVDSLKILKSINNEAAKLERKIACLLQVHIADEKTKYGFQSEELVEMLSDSQFKALKNIEIHGLMGMATYTSDIQQIREEFTTIRELHTKIKKQFFADKATFKELSIGMSQDYKIAIESGSTMVRIGTAVFGDR